MVVDSRGTLLWDKEEDTEKPLPLTLTDVEKFDDGAVLLRYKV